MSLGGNFAIRNSCSERFPMRLTHALRNTDRCYMLDIGHWRGPFATVALGPGVRSLSHRGRSILHN